MAGKSKVEPEQLTAAILGTLQANGGKMSGRMSSDLKSENIKGSEVWRSYAANLVSERLGVSDDKVYRHFLNDLKDRTIDGWHYWGSKGKELNDHWFWHVSKDQDEEGDSDV